MKKYRLKKWVKVGLISVILLGMAFANYSLTDNAIEQCVNAGNTYNYCANGLK